jgi:drug/metabolite transporter (DMT)-like permease
MGAMDSTGSPRNLRPYAFVLGGVMLGGLSPVFTKLLLLEGVEGPTLVAARYLLAVIFLAPFGVPQHRPVEGGKPDRRAWITLILVGVFGSGLGSLLFTAAVDLASAGVVNAISKTAPIFVALFAYFTLRERVTYLRFLLVAVMVAADLLIVAGELSFSGQLVSTRLLGDLLALGAGMTRAAAEILGKSALRKFTPSTVALWRFGVGLAVAGGVSAGTGGWVTLGGLGISGWTIMLLLAGVSTALYMTLYYRGLAEIPAHVAVSLKLLGAVVTVIVSWIVLREALTPYHIAGIAVLISGAYLLVMRSAQPAPETVAPVSPGRRPWARLRPRLVGLVVLLVVASVSVVWYLSIRHSVQLLRQQVQLTVGEVAAILVEFGGIEERPSWQSYQQYLRRVVGHRVEGDIYALEVVYVAALDPRGSIGAWAISPELQLVTDGRELQIRDRAEMQQLLVEMERGAAQHGIITATAELISEGRVVGTLKLGARRELSEGMVGEIVGRSAVAALTVLLLAAAIATLVVGGMVEPLERLTAQLWARRGAAEGAEKSEDMDEVEQIRRALGVVGQAIGLERRTIASLSLVLAERARSREQQLCIPGPDGVWLALLLPPGAGISTAAAALESVAREAARQGGLLTEAAARCALATWGGERDDALRATLAAAGLQDAMVGEASTGVPVIVIGAGGDADGWCEAAEVAAEAGDERLIPVIMGPAAFALARDHLQARPLDGSDGFMLIEGQAEAPELAGVVREPED